MEILNCPKCGKQPTFSLYYSALYSGYGAWYTIQCKPLFRSPHLIVTEGKVTKERCLKYAIKHWNDKVNNYKGE